MKLKPPKLLTSNCPPHQENKFSSRQNCGGYMIHVQVWLGGTQNNIKKKK